MNRPRENDAENEQDLMHYGPAEAEAMQGLLFLNPRDLPQLFLDQHNLIPLGSGEGFSVDCSATDVDDRYQWLLIPADDARQHIVPHVPGGSQSRRRVAIPIGVYLRSGAYHPLLFKERKCDNKFVITHRKPPEITRWSHVCCAMGLQEGDEVKMWVLGHLESQELCIFMAKQIREG